MNEKHQVDLGSGSVGKLLLSLALCVGIGVLGHFGW